MMVYAETDSREPAGEPARRVAVLGLDPSLTSFGAALAGAATPPLVYRWKTSGMRGHRRLAYLLERVSWLADSADVAVIESPAFTGNNVETFRNLSGLYWMTVHKLWQLAVPYAAVTPATRMKWLTGSGSAGKDEVLAAAIKRFPFADLHGNDEADALTLAAMGCQHYGQPLVAMPADRTALLTAMRTEKNHRHEPKIEWPVLEESKLTKK